MWPSASHGWEQQRALRTSKARAALAVIHTVAEP